MSTACQIESSTLFKTTFLWTAPAVRVRVGRDETQLWIAPIGFDAVDVPAAWKTLSSDEKKRAQQFPYERDAGLFIRSRFQLRLLLSHCLGIRPNDVRFEYGDNGKPRLAGDSPIRFNLSRSQNTVVIGLTLADEIGVDIGHVSGEVSVESMAADRFCPRELEAMERAEPGSRRSLYYRIWTAKEALMKATGKDLAIDPRSIEVSIDDDGRITGYVDAVTGAQRSDWQLQSVQFPNDLAAAIACRAQKCLLVFQA